MGFGNIGDAGGMEGIFRGNRGITCYNVDL